MKSAKPIKESVLEPPTPEEERLLTSLRAKTWKEFQGQESVVEALHIAIAAAKRGARVVCVDLDPERIAQARANATTAGVVNLITFRLESFFET